jgi:hypothetical protein
MGDAELGILGGNECVGVLLMVVAGTCHKGGGWWMLTPWTRSWTQVLWSWYSEAGEAA